MTDPARRVAVLCGAAAPLMAEVQRQAQEFVVDSWDGSAAAARVGVEEILRRHGRLDAWVNVPELHPDEPPAETNPLPEWSERAFAYPTVAFATCQAAGRHMLKQRQGVLINVCTTDRDRFATRSATSTAMAAVAALTRSLGVEWARCGVRVVGVSQLAPYTMDTVPLGREPTTEELAAAISFLLSDDSQYMTAEVLNVDGAFTAYGLF